MRHSRSCSSRRARRELAEQVRSVLPSYASCIYIRQPAPLGLGHAVLCARPAVGDEPFFVHLADDLIDAEVPCLKQMAETYNAHGGSVLGRGGGAAAATPTSTASSRSRPATAPVSRIQQHRREAQARGGALDSGGGRPLRADADDLRRARAGRPGRGRRDPADRRHRAAAAARAGVRPSLRAAGASTAAASSAICRRPSSCRWRTRQLGKEFPPATCWRSPSKLELAAPTRTAAPGASRWRCELSRSRITP